MSLPGIEFRSSGLWSHLPGPCSGLFLKLQCFLLEPSLNEFLECWRRQTTPTLNEVAKKNVFVPSVPRIENILTSVTLCVYVFGRREDYRMTVDCAVLPCCFLYLHFSTRLQLLQRPGGLSMSMPCAGHVTENYNDHCHLQSTCCVSGTIPNSVKQFIKSFQQPDELRHSLSEFYRWGNWGRVTCSGIGLIINRSQGQPRQPCSGCLLLTLLLCIFQDIKS